MYFYYVNRCPISVCKTDKRTLLSILVIIVEHVNRFIDLTIKWVLSITKI